MTLGRRSLPPETVDNYYQQGWWRDRTIIDDFLQQVEQRPNHTAIVSQHAGGPTTRHTYAELELLSRRFAGAFVELGVEKGDVVSIQLPNTWEFPALVYGALRAGAVVNPLVPIFRSRELSFILERTASKVLVVPDSYRSFDHTSMALDLLETVPTLQHIVAVGPDAPAAALSFDDFFVDRKWEDRPGLVDVMAERAAAADDLIEIQFTSGTTGEPKGVLHSHNTLFSGGRAITDVYGLGPDDVCFMASTLAHQTGFGYGMTKPLSEGMTIVYQDIWDAEGMLDAIEHEGVSWTVSATAFVVDLVAAQRRNPRDVSAFKYFICGGAPIPPRVVEESMEVLGAELVAVWGMTENMIVTTTRAGDAVSLVSDSDGTVVDWMEIRVTNDDGTPVAAGESGNLACRGPSQALGYFHRPDLYEAASPDGDWFDTGDVARLRDDGGIRIVGRTKDIIIRGGENVPVAEVEAALYRHPSVAEVSIIGIPHERLGEQACAFVAPEGTEPTLSELTTFLDELGMAKQFWPERLEIMADMPKTPSGKIQKFKLRELIEGT